MFYNPLGPISAVCMNIGSLTVATLLKRNDSSSLSTGQLPVVRQLHLGGACEPLLLPCLSFDLFDLVMLVTISALNS